MRGAKSMKEILIDMAEAAKKVKQYCNIIPCSACPIKTCKEYMSVESIPRKWEIDDGENE